MDRREFVQGIWHKSVYGNHAERGLKTVLEAQPITMHLNNKM